MNPRYALWSVALVMPACLGCEAPVRIRPGMSAVRLSLRAEPKVGYLRPNAAISSADQYGSAMPAGGRRSTGAYELVDYRKLDNIVVWVEPQGAPLPEQSPPTVRVDVFRTAPADASIQVTGVGGLLVFENTGTQTQVVYSLSDSNEFDLGEIGPGQQARHAVQHPGLIEVLTESSDRPIAQVFAAPTPWVRQTRSGERITFTDLPPGTCRASCWHPRLPGSTATFRLTADTVTEATLTVGVNSLPSVH